jgi:low temperature requirement protein LtrA
VLWISWSGYLWLGNTAGTDEGAIRVVLFTAMGAVLVVSLAVPNAFGKDALVFGVAFFFVRGSAAPDRFSPGFRRRAPDEARVG